MTDEGLTVPIAIDADLVSAASLVAPLEHRSIAHQLSHWARLGAELERSESPELRRVRRVAAGGAQCSELDDDERGAADALIDGRIADRAARVRFGEVVRSAGQTTVSVDDDGNLVEIAPDGTRHRL